MSRLLVLAALLLLSPPLLANTSERLREADFAPRFQLEQAELQLQNQSVLRYLWADVYAAAFYTPAQISPPAALADQHSKRLELYYFRQIDRDDVIEAAWTTLKRQRSRDSLERLNPELNALHAQFRDIRPGDRYALNYSPHSGLSLERNGQLAYSSTNRELASAYLGIWLAPKGLSEDLRESLLAD